MLICILILQYFHLSDMDLNQGPLDDDDASAI